MTASEAAAVPAGDATWRADLKSRSRDTRLRAVLAVNSELIRLTWRIGRDMRAARAGCRDPGCPLD